MARENVTFEVEDGIGLVTISRPAVLNALDSRTLDELAEVLEEVEHGAARALIVTGAGDRAFVAGADIAAMARLAPTGAKAFAERAHAVFTRLERLAVPTIAAVNGFALGGGCELLLACDLAYASERARLGLPEVGLGLIPGFGGTQRLPRRVGVMRALELILIGEPCDAARAQELGLVLEVVAPERLLPRAREQAKKILARGPLAVAQVKRIVHAGAGMSLEDALELERQAFAATFASADAREGMKAFLEKRPPRFQGE